MLADVETVLKGTCYLTINWFSDNLMQDNPSKFQCNILIGSKEKETLWLPESVTPDVIVIVGAEIPLE